MGGRGDIAQRVQTFSYECILMYGLVTTTDNHVYLKFAKEVNHKCCSYFPPPKMVPVGGKGYGNFIVVIILPCTHTLYTLNVYNFYLSKIDPGACLEVQWLRL